MANTKINTLNELRARKEQLKQELEGGFENPFDNVKQLLGKYTAGDANPVALFDKSENGRNELMDEGVKAILTIVASTAVTRFKLGPIPKLLITTGVAIATPYIVDKIQEKIRGNKN